MSARTPSSSSRLLAALLCFVAAAALLGVPRVSRAVEYNFSGSAQLDYHFIAPIGPSVPRAPLNALAEGFTQELSIKAAVDVTAHLSANVKVCWGCHGLELAMGYFDYRVADELNIRVGRFTPTFGEFQLRHDPASHRTSDRPLPYDMGRMLYLTQFNRSVLPLPYVETGIEVSGSHFFGNRVQLDYAAHAVAGLRSLAPSGQTDVDFAASRGLPSFQVDNNAAPSVGGRVGLTFRLGDRTDLTLGGSAIWGPYDRFGTLNYLILGADAYLRAGRTNLRAEYLVRRTEMSAETPDRFRYEFPRNGDGTPMLPLFNTKDGWYVELEQPINRRLELVLRWDGLRRLGNIENSSELTNDAGISRVTVGANVLIERGYRLKLNVEHWMFWGFRENLGPGWLLAGYPQALSAHLSAVATF